MLFRSVTVIEGTASTTGFFRTQGNQIIDADGRPVRIAGVNWFGLETGPSGIFVGSSVGENVSFPRRQGPCSTRISTNRFSA